MTGYGNIGKNQARLLVSKRCVQFDAPKKIKLCSASRMTFRAWFLQNRSPKYWRTIRNTFRLFEKHFENERAKQSPDLYLGPKSFRTIFENRTPVYSLAAPLLGLPKSIY